MEQPVITSTSTTTTVGRIGAQSNQVLPENMSGREIKARQEVERAAHQLWHASGVVTASAVGPQKQKAPHGPLWVSARRGRVNWWFGRLISVGVVLLVLAVVAIAVAGGLKS